MSTTSLPGRQDRAVLWLLENGHVSAADVRLAEAARAADPSRPELLDHLIAAGTVRRESAAHALGSLFRGEAVADVTGFLPDPEVKELIPPETARRLGAAPLVRAGRIVTIAVCDPYDLGVLAELDSICGPHLESRPVLADACAIYARIAELTRDDAHADVTDVGDLTQRAATEAGRRGEGNGASLDRQVHASAVAQLADRILHDAVREGASDIHIEFYPGFGWVRFRVDGVLREWAKLPAELEQDLVGHIKARATGMDSVNRLIPQDGRLTLRTGRGGDVEFRVSTLPTVIGEKAVLRVLDRRAQALSLPDLGLGGRNLDLVEEAMGQSWGMILVTGPTGSGKSTTLYSILGALARPEVNIVTIEDPVERRMPMVTQVGIRRTDDQKTSLSYASVLRSVLRQDPNIIMVGEIRDAETAETATRAAMTGHLLLSTLHTNDAASAVSRLMDMGVEPYNVAGTLRLVIAQRLVRRICAACAEPCDPDPSLLALAQIEPRRIAGVRFLRGKGCEVCGGSGYRGRIGLYEILEVSDPVRRLIAQGRSDKEIAAAGLAGQMQPLRQAGWARIREGLTTLEEVLKET